MRAPAASMPPPPPRPAPPRPARPAPPPPAPPAPLPTLARAALWPERRALAACMPTRGCQQCSGALMPARSRRARCAWACRHAVHDVQRATASQPAPPGHHPRLQPMQNRRVHLGRRGGRVQPPRSPCPPRLPAAPAPAAGSAGRRGRRGRRRHATTWRRCTRWRVWWPSRSIASSTALSTRWPRRLAQPAPPAVGIGVQP